MGSRISAGQDAYAILKAFFEEERISRNEITGFLEQEGTVLSEQAVNQLFIRVKQDNPKCIGLTKQAFDIGLNSDTIPRINPIRSFFREGKTNAQTGYIKKLIDSLNILPCPELERVRPGMTREVVETLFEKWMVGVAASVEGKNYNCLMFVLIGKKGCGKTEFFRRLMPTELLDYFAQSKLADGKDSEALMCEKLIILNDELDGLHSREARTFRSFISANSYTHRPAYARQNVTRKRLASVCGASNDRNIIMDGENNRRIIPVEILGVDHESYNAVDKRSVFWEAGNLFRGGYDWNLNNEDMANLDKLSESYEMPSIEYELIQRYFSPEGGTMEWTASEVKKEIEEVTHQKLSLHKVGSNLKRLGFQSKMIRRNGKPCQVYSLNCLIRREV